MESKRTGPEAAVLTAPALTRAAEGAIRFLLGAILASGSLLPGSHMGCAPFGVGFVAASGAGMEGLCALLGAAAGYLWCHGLVGGIRWAAAAVLCYSVAFAFLDACRWRWFLPAVAGGMDALTGFVYLSDWGWESGGSALFGAEILLCALSAHLYRRAGRDLNAGTAWLGLTLLISLAPVELTAGFSLGRVLSALLVLTGSWLGGPGVGAAAGVGLGLGMDLAAGAAIFYAAAYGLSGLLTGASRRQGRLFGTLAFLTANAAVVLWSWENGRLPGLWEGLTAAVLFLLLPEKGLRRLWSGLARQETAAGTWGADLVRRGLERKAGAFRELGAALRNTFPPSTPNDEDPATLFDRTARRVCGRCTLRDTCWEREYENTKTALNDALPALLDRGRGEGGDFPLWFTSRCLSFPAFLEGVNEELTALRYRRQYQTRLRESRGAVTRQYETLAQVLTEASAELSAQPVADPLRERKVRSWLAQEDLEGTPTVYYDLSGRLRIKITGGGTPKLAKSAVDRLSQAVGLPLRRQEGEAFGFFQAEPLLAVAGAAARRREGQRESGDTGTWFKREDGSLFVLLCDGMGSGPDAHRESALAVRLLEKFLLAGVETRAALRTVNGGLALKNEDTGAFTTVDLLRLDLYTGQGEVCKLGAAPTYLRRQGKVSRIGGVSLPAGLTGGEAPDCTPLDLAAGDLVVLLSDGVADSQEDGWVRELLSAFPGDSPKDLAQSIMAESERRVGAADDRTAVVIFLKSR